MSIGYLTQTVQGERPDITPIQIIVILIGAVPQLIVLFGLHLSTQQADSLDKLTAGAIALLASDLGLRGVRNLKAAKVESAAAQSVGSADGSEQVDNPDNPVVPNHELTEADLGNLENQTLPPTEEIDDESLPVDRGV